MAIACRLASGPRVPCRYTKESLNRAVLVELGVCLHMEAANDLRTAQREAVAAFVESAKRPRGDGSPMRGVRLRKVALVVTISSRWSSRFAGSWRAGNDPRSGDLAGLVLATSDRNGRIRSGVHLGAIVDSDWVLVVRRAHARQRETLKLSNRVSGGRCSTRPTAPPEGQTASFGNTRFLALSAWRSLGSCVPKNCQTRVTAE
jgi:hypothetical protein